MRTRLAVFVVLVSLALPVPADACMCYTGLGRCGDVQQADAVFEATVESIALEAASASEGFRSMWDVEGSSAAPLRVVMSGTRAVRGEAAEIVTTPRSSGSCGYTFAVGQRYLIVGRRLPDGRVYVDMCGLTRPVSSAAGLIDYVQTLAGPPSQTLVWGSIEKMFSQVGLSETVAVAGARVSVSGTERRTVVSDAAGRYRIAGLRHGNYTMTVEPPSTASDLVPPESIDFPLDADVPHACQELGFRLTRLREP